jgi:GTP cyclohydrolase IA
MDKFTLTMQQVNSLVCLLAQDLVEDVITSRNTDSLCGISIYGVPRGGIPVAYAVALACQKITPSNFNFYVTETLQEAHVIVDDIVDSGATRLRYAKLHDCEFGFRALIDKTQTQDPEWVVFPWEVGEDGKDESFTDNVVRLLQYVGEDPNREGLRGTPSRVAKAWAEWCGGYEVDVPKLFTGFEDGAERYDQMVVVKDIPFYSHCEHHLAPFFGTVTIAYIPDSRIVGLSKLNRVVKAYAQRLQVQERLTNQIADCLESNLKCVGVGVMIKARHLCMESRGIGQQGHHTITSALRGSLYSDPSCRAEFYSIARS